MIRTLAVLALALTLTACSGAQCWPTELRRELECPATHPYRNEWHPDLCYATKEAAGLK